ncbi:hypothetical protein [Streptomyces aureoverticillatus]|uniref:hypothetical protein n=1 Tax=Streptomyces aureoverticillatus TaxID=66871 RepID=UPI0013DA51B6|nr:hypothetical protein [Streptomyces aureoverticillatus]QIB44878.1 hypothetical protein G3H79_19135 [Streptomyces aureoverticillatus]
MSSRTRPRARTVKVPAGATTVRIPRQRGRRQQSFLLVVPERPTLSSQALRTAGRLLWRHRLALLPTGLAVLSLIVTAVLHALAPWASVLVATVGLLPLIMLLTPSPYRRRLADENRAWKWGAAAVAAVVGLWSGLAILLGPLAGPLEVLWFLGLLAAHGLWFALRRMTAKEKD